MAKSEKLAQAKVARKDEFYTQLADVENELRHYRKHFKGKTVFCNCDDPFESNFFKYFVQYLETAILWAASAEGKTIEQYMAAHQHDPSAVSLWNYFRSVIDWEQAIFPKRRREMKGLPWGLLNNEHGTRSDLDPKKLEAEAARLMGDEDVTRKSGIYEYLLTGDERKLSIRAFDRRDALAAYGRQSHKCAICGETFEFEAMHADHIQPWSKGGHTTPGNCQMLCRDCNLKKGAQ